MEDWGMKNNIKILYWPLFVLVFVAFYFFGQRIRFWLKYSIGIPDAVFGVIIIIIILFGFGLFRKKSIKK